MVYELRLPWAALGPVQPAPNMRMGINYIMFNNNGDGHLDTLHLARASRRHVEGAVSLGHIIASRNMNRASS